MPYPKNKYRKGYTIFGVDELANEVVLGHWLFYKGRVIHPSFIGHMNLFTIIGGIKARVFHFAIDQQKEYYESETLCPFMRVKKQHGTS